MTTRRKKNNNNNKSKKVKKYINGNNTRKRYQTGGLAKIHHKTKKHILKNVTQFKKKAKGRRGIKVEFKFINALSEFLGDPKIPQKVKDRKNSTAKYDIDRNMSPRLNANYSIKSVAQTSQGQTKFQICMGNTCRVFESFSQASDPLEMAIIIRYEHMIESGQIPLSTAVYDMHKYKSTLFGNLSDKEIRMFNTEIGKLEKLAKYKTYDAFKQFDQYEDAPATVIREAKEAKTYITKTLTDITKIIERRGGKLVVRLSDANWFKRRPPRIVSHWDYSPSSPRVKASETKASRAIAAMPDIQQLTDSGSMSAESGKGSAAAAAAVVPVVGVAGPPAIVRSLTLNPHRRSTSRRSRSNRPGNYAIAGIKNVSSRFSTSLGSRSNRSVSTPPKVANPSTTRSVRNKLLGINKARQLPTIVEELEKKGMSVSNLLPPAYRGLNPSSRPFRKSTFNPSLLSDRPVLRSSNIFTSSKLP